MSSFKNDIIDFSQFCKENQFFISIDKLETYFKYIESKQIESIDDKLKYLFLLIPKDKDEKDQLQYLINEFFNFSTEEKPDFNFNYLDEYKLNDNFEDIFIDQNNINIDFSSIAIDIIQEFENLDFSDLRYHRKLTRFELRIYEIITISAQTLYRGRLQSRF